MFDLAGKTRATCFGNRKQNPGRTMEKTAAYLEDFDRTKEKIALVDAAAHTGVVIETEYSPESLKVLEGMDIKERPEAFVPEEPNA